MSTRPALLAVAAAALLGAVPAHASSSYCDPPRRNGFDFSYVHESGIGCHSARQLVLVYLSNGHITGWNCSHQLRPPRRTILTCYNAAHHNETLGASWNAH